MTEELKDIEQDVYKQERSRLEAEDRAKKQAQDDMLKEKADEAEKMKQIKLQAKKEWDEQRRNEDMQARNQEIRKIEEASPLTQTTLSSTSQPMVDNKPGYPVFDTDTFHTPGQIKEIMEYFHKQSGAGQY